MTRLFARVRFATSRDLGLGAAMTLVAAVVLDRTGPLDGANAFFVGVLFGLAIGIGVFALGVFGRERTSRG